MDSKSFEILMYDITANVVATIIENTGWKENIAFERWTQSKVYSYLEREETKFWQYSSTMLFTLFNEEREGNLLIPEV